MPSIWQNTLNSMAGSTWWLIYSGMSRRLRATNTTISLSFVWTNIPDLSPMREDFRHRREERALRPWRSVCLNSFVIILGYSVHDLFPSFLQSIGLHVQRYSKPPTRPNYLNTCKHLAKSPILTNCSTQTPSL